MAHSRDREPERQGWFRQMIGGLLQAIIQFIMRLLGFGKRGARATVEPLDQKYREYVDTWVSSNIARWLHETRADIDTEMATKVLMGEWERYPETTSLVRETLIDAKVTFSHRENKQYLEIEAYMAPRQLNGKQPQILRWKAEREIDWQEIPDDVRERLIRVRQPVTLGYVVPNAR